MAAELNCARRARKIVEKKWQPNFSAEGEQEKKRLFCIGMLGNLNVTDSETAQILTSI